MSRWKNPLDDGGWVLLAIGLSIFAAGFICGVVATAYEIARHYAKP